MAVKPNASWCDLVTAPWGAGFVYLQGSTVVCEDADTGSQRWSGDAGHALLYLRAAADGRGRVLAAGQSGDDGAVRAVIDGRAGVVLGFTGYPFSVIVRGESDGWTVFIQRTGVSYDAVRVSGNGRTLSSEPHAMPATSQGFLYLGNDGDPVPSDEGDDRIPGLWLPTPSEDGTVWAGQSHTEESIALFDTTTGRISHLGTHAGQPPHIVQRGADFYICAYVHQAAWFEKVRRPFGGSPNQGDVEWTSAEPIDTLPLFVGEASNWPRTGSHDLHQVWDSRNLHLIKFGSADSWERWVLDGNAWYLREDRSQSGAGDYSFHDGLWSPRHAQLGVWNERPSNVLQRYEPGSCKVIDQHKLPYRTALIKAWSRIDCGGDIGIVTGSPAAVLLAYDAGSQADTWEQYLFVRGWGLVRWTVQDQRDPSVSHTTTFNERGGQALTPTQGCWRRELVPWPPSTPKPPDPKPTDPPPPDPKPRPSMRQRLSLKSTINDRVVCADRNIKSPGSRGGVCVRANRDNWDSPGAWEEHEVEFCSDGTLAFRSQISDEITALWSGDPELSGRDQHMLCANRPDQPSNEAGPAERWEPVFVPEATRFNGTEVIRNAWALKNVFNGKFLTIDPRDPEGRIYARGDAANENELFYSTVPLVRGASGGGHVGGGTVKPPTTDLDRIDGQLQAESGGGFVVNGRPVLPILCHFGDAFSRWSRGQQGAVSADLDDIAAAGYHGIRFWSTLGGDSAYWHGRGVTPNETPDYWAHLEAFLVAIRDRGLVCQLSQGDVRNNVIPDRRSFAYEMAERVSRVGPHVVALFEGANESRDTGEPDARRLAEFVSAFHERCPQPLVALSAYTGTEDVSVLNEFSRSPANVFVCHGYRGGRWWDKVRHIMSLVYEGKPSKRLGWQGEPGGPGSRVSAIDNRGELDADALCAMAIMSLMTRQAWVYFSGPGVISDEGERLQDMPGFREVPQVRALLPQDVMRFDQIFHGGETWARQRIFAAQGEVRADHATSGDGRFACLVYGHGSLDVPQTRAASIEKDVRFGSKARLIVGRAE